MSLPDPSVVLKRLSGQLTSVVEKDKELMFRTQLWRSLHSLDTSTTWEKLDKWLVMIEGEMSQIQLQENVAGKVKRVEVQKEREPPSSPGKGSNGKGSGGKGESSWGKKGESS